MCVGWGASKSVSEWETSKEKLPSQKIKMALERLMEVGRERWILDRRKKVRK